MQQLIASLLKSRQKILFTTYKTLCLTQLLFHHDLCFIDEETEVQRLNNLRHYTTLLVLKGPGTKEEMASRNTDKQILPSEPPEGTSPHTVFRNSDLQN